MPVTDFMLGKHAQAIADLKTDVAAMTVKLDRVVSFVDGIEGAWKTAAFGLAAIGAAIGVLMTFVTDYVKHRMWS